MRRRRFLGSVAAAGLLGRIARAESLPSDLKITRIVSFDLHTRRVKFVGKNAVRGDHGQTSRDRMTRLYTNMDVEAYRPFVDARALDMLQGDMYGLGIEGILAEAAMAEPHGILVAPHNWSSLLSLFMQVHVGLVVPNFYRAEHDPLSSDVLVYDGYEIKDGFCSVPDAPGFGLSLNENRFDRVSVNFDLKV